jgi:flagellar basal-body rod modification protein FlgD
MDVAATAPPLPTAAASTGALSSLTKNIDSFLTLLTAQLRNQDPLEPLDTEKFTSQLVQFASVEQSIKTNSHLEALIALQGAQDRGAAIGFVGREISVATDKSVLKAGEARWTYALPGAAGAVALRIFDARGAEIARGPGATSAGAHEFSWDGTTAAGAKAPEGVYRLQVDAIGTDGATIAATTEVKLTAEAARFGAGAPSLETDIGAVALDAVRRIARQ